MGSFMGLRCQVAPPKGKGARVTHGDFIEKSEDFLNSVEEMASNMLMAVYEYNQMAAIEDGTTGLPQIEGL